MSSYPPVDIVILCPLSEEINALLTAFNIGSIKHNADGYNYYTIKLKNINIRIVRLRYMGVLSTGVTTADIINKWSPWCVISYGIAGNLSKDIQPGDVIVGKTITYYEPRKEITLSDDSLDNDKMNVNVDLTIENRPGYYRVPPIHELDQFIEDFHSSSIKELISGKLFHGDIASGEGKLSSNESVSRERILKINSNFLCVEMEAAGLVAATDELNNRRRIDVKKQILWIVVKGISDNADSKSSDSNLSNEGKEKLTEDRNLAANNSAIILKNILEKMTPRIEDFWKSYNPLKAEEKIKKFRASLSKKIDFESTPEKYISTLYRMLRDDKALPPIYCHWRINYNDEKLHWIDFSILLALKKLKNEINDIPIHLLITDVKENVAINTSIKDKLTKYINNIFNDECNVTWLSDLYEHQDDYLTWAYKNRKLYDEDVGQQHGVLNNDLWCSYIAYMARDIKKCIVFYLYDDFTGLLGFSDLEISLLKRKEIKLAGNNAKSENPGKLLYLHPPNHESVISFIKNEDEEIIEELIENMELNNSCKDINDQEVKGFAESLNLNLNDIHASEIIRNKILVNLINWNKNYFTS